MEIWINLKRFTHFTEYIYKKIIEDTDNVERLLAELKHEENTVDQETFEELERSSFALQVARDVLENRVALGKKVGPILDGL